MGYFGPGEFKLEWEDQVATPIGKICGFCGEAVEEHDMGTVNGEQVLHHECLIRTLHGSVGHQQGRCACCGGTEEDPPGLTRREAAIAAAIYAGQLHCNQNAQVVGRVMRAVFVKPH